MDECRVEAAARGAAFAAVVSGDEKPSVIEEAELFRLRVAEARIDTAMRQLEDRRRLIEAAVLAASRGGSASAPGEGHV